MLREEKKQKMAGEKVKRYGMVVSDFHFKKISVEKIEFWANCLFLKTGALLTCANLSLSWDKTENIANNSKNKAKTNLPSN